MTASDNRSTRITQKSLFPGSQLFSLGTVAAVGLLGTQAVLAQTDMGSAIDLAIPDAPSVVAEPLPPIAAPVVPAAPEISIPVAPVAPVAPIAVPPPEVIEPVIPNSVVPTSVPTATEPTVADSLSSEPDVTDYGAVFIETPDRPDIPTLDSLLGRSQASTSETPAVEVISPVDYGTAQVDTTDYSVGATMPNVVISERASGCEFSVQTGQQLANTACQQFDRLAAAFTEGLAQQGSLNTAAGFVNTASSFVGVPGIQPVMGLTTAASREYYNQAAQAVVQLQQGEKFIFPLSIPASLTSLFGWRVHPIVGARRFHSGTDLGAPLGTPVVATQSGQVTVSDFLGGYGLTVILHHNNGTLESRYTHLSRLLVRAGEQVEQGEVIGLVGSTGNSTGPHLHFELRQLAENGWVVLNPDSLMRQMLGTLAQALGNSLVALSENSTVETVVKAPQVKAVPLKGLPFRPAQPHAN